MRGGSPAGRSKSPHWGVLVHFALCCSPSLLGGAATCRAGSSLGSQGCVELQLWAPAPQARCHWLSLTRPRPALRTPGVPPVTPPPGPRFLCQEVWCRGRGLARQAGVRERRQALLQLRSPGPSSRAPGLALGSQLLITCAVGLGANLRGQTAEVTRRALPLVICNPAQFH